MYCSCALERRIELATVCKQQKQQWEQGVQWVIVLLVRAWVQVAGACAMSHFSLIVFLADDVLMLSSCLHAATFCYCFNGHCIRIRRGKIRTGRGSRKGRKGLVLTSKGRTENPQLHHRFSSMFHALFSKGHATLLPWSSSRRKREFDWVLLVRHMCGTMIKHDEIERKKRKEVLAPHHFPPPSYPHRTFLQQSLPYHSCTVHSQWPAWTKSGKRRIEDAGWSEKNAW